ncbi:MAG TPA: hypothetical protein VNQ77_09720 [Frankiaceae bacterium]|nr:hypothetical protein [Frankiaceae bacterium]
MRIALALVAAAATAAAAVVLSAPSASAIPCPKGTEYRVVALGVGTCVPTTACDPGCTPPPVD